MFTQSVSSRGGSARALSWTEYGVDGTTAMLLDQVEPTGTPFDQLERIGTWEKVISWAQAQQCAEITRFVGDAVAAPGQGMNADQAVESAQAEVGLMLTLTPGGTAWRVTDARTLVEDFPATFAALRSGSITLAKARVVTEGCADLSADAAAAVQVRVLARAPRQTTSQLRRSVARAVKREDGAAAERRRARKQRERGVVLYPERDGMATLSATLPAAEAVGMFAVLDQHARACGSADGRSMDARRGDALTDLVLHETGFCSTGTAPIPDPATPTTDTADTAAMSATGTAAGEPTDPDAPVSDEAVSDAPVSDAPVSDAPVSDETVSDAPIDDEAVGAEVTAGRGGAGAVLPVAPVPARLPGIIPECGTRTATTNVSIQIRVIALDSLRGDSEEPGELAGYGPITAAQARELAADPASTWRRLVTDPLTGGIVDYGTTRYRPPPEMVERVITRHQHCQYPGCRVPAHRCDLDHNEPFDPVADTGPTSDANLGPKCRPHHRLKGLRGWNVHQYPDGSIEWITPSGHRYMVEPPPLTEPRVPEPDDSPPPF